MPVIFLKVTIDAVFALRRKRNEMFLLSKSINNTKTAKNGNKILQSNAFKMQNSCCQRVIHTKVSTLLLRGFQTFSV